MAGLLWTRRRLHVGYKKLYVEILKLKLCVFKQPYPNSKRNPRPRQPCISGGFAGETSPTTRAAPTSLAARNT